MAIEFNGTTAGQIITFNADLSALTQYSVLAWIRPDTGGFDVGGGVRVGNICEVGNANYFLFRTRHNAEIPNTLYFAQYFSTSPGAWYSPASSITLGATQHVAVTFDRSNAANNPLFYINGSNVLATEDVTPSGTSSLNSSVDIGNSDAGSRTFDGRLISVQIHSGILSPAEIADAYNSREWAHIKRGLVFAPHLIGAAGIQNYDGATLAVANTLSCQASGALGVPAGSPVGYADDFLTFNNCF